MAYEHFTYRLVDISSPKIDRMLSAIRKSHVNGGAVFGCFESDDLLGYETGVATDGLTGADSFFFPFLQSPSVASALPELQISTPLHLKPALHRSVPFAIEGELAHIILAGGAYDRFRGSVAEARQICRDFMEEMVGGEWMRHTAAITYTPWTDWFHGILWDATFVVRDQEACRIWLLCITDSD